MRKSARWFVGTTQRNYTIKTFNWMMILIDMHHLDDVIIECEALNKHKNLDCFPTERSPNTHFMLDWQFSRQRIIVSTFSPTPEDNESEFIRVWISFNRICICIDLSPLRKNTLKYDLDLAHSIFKVIKMLLEMT